jgi:hypothetical protein
MAHRCYWSGSVYSCVVNRAEHTPPTVAVGVFHSRDLFLCNVLRFRLYSWLRFKLLGCRSVPLADTGEDTGKIKAEGWIWAEFQSYLDRLGGIRVLSEFVDKGFDTELGYR